MTQCDKAWLRHQQTRWLRPDGARWLRPDAARYLIPGTDPAEVFPVLAQKRDRQRVARSAMLEHLATELSAIAALRRELDAVKLELHRRNLQADLKYSPSQPRIPAGQTGGGRWTRDGGGVATTPEATQAAAPDLALPMGNIDIGATGLSGGREAAVGINDSRVMSDADPDRIVPGADYAYVIPVCIVGSRSLSTDYLGNKTYTVTYDCANGRSFTTSGTGHSFPGIVREKFR
jgi:hypothetical protein